MGISDGNILYYHGVAEGNEGRKISTLEYNNRTVYEYFYIPSADEFGCPYSNLPPITFDDIPRLHKRSRYTPDLHPVAMYFASKIF